MSSIPPTLNEESRPNPTCPADWLGKQFGRFKILGVAGEGGMGWVFRAHDNIGSREVALKMPRGASSCSETALKRLEQEIRAAKKMPHTSVVRIFDDGTIDGTRYYSMELVEGTTLNRWISEQLPALDKRVQVFTSLCEAIFSFHKRSLTHRDLKPENLMVDADGNLRVLDFGLAKFDAGSQATMPGSILGSLHCMAPEQTGTGEKPGKPADVYALGMIGYWLFTGQFPYSLNDLSEDERVNTIRHASIRPPSELNPALIRAWDEILLRCLNKNPAKRFQSAQELLEAVLNLKVPRSQVSNTLAGNGADPAQDPETAHSTSSTEEANYYVERRSDKRLAMEIRNQSSIILLCGPRQSGKTLALQRQMMAARSQKRRVAIVDCEGLNQEGLASPKLLYQDLADRLASELNFKSRPKDWWDEDRAPNLNLQTFLEEHVLERSQEPVIWAFDSVDRLFSHPTANSLFSLFRAWHNMKTWSKEWSKLTLVLVYAQEDKDLIADDNQSPFNVGVRIDIEDFTLAEVGELNKRHGDPPPITRNEDIKTLHGLMGGQPDLLRRAFRHLRDDAKSVAELVTTAEAHDGPFERSYQRLERLAKREPQRKFLETLLKKKSNTDQQTYSALRAEGLIIGPSPEKARFRSELYRRWASTILETSTTWWSRFVP